MKKLATYDLFSPNIFVIAFGFCFAFYTLSLSESMSSPSTALVFYFLACLFFFVIGVTFSYSIRLKEKIKDQKYISPKIAWVGVLIATALYIFEHAVFVIRYGNIPLLLPNVELLRFDFMVNGYVHLLAIMGRIWLAVLLSINLHSNVSLRKYVPIFVFIIITLTLDLMVGNRGEFLMFLFLLTVVLSFYKNFTKWLVISLPISLVFLGVGKTFRDYALYGDLALSSAASDWILGDSFFSVSLYNVYMALTYNLNMLNEYIVHLKGYYYGYFTILAPLTALFPGERFTTGDLQRHVLGIDFHGTLTSTILSFPYIDFGYFGAIYMLLFGFVGGFLFRKAVKNRAPLTVVMYAYFSLNLFLGMYTYMFSQFFVLVNFLVIYLYLPANKFLVRFGGR